MVKSCSLWPRQRRENLLKIEKVIMQALFCVWSELESLYAFDFAILKCLGA